MKIVVINLFNAKKRANSVSSALTQQSLPHSYFHGLDNNQFQLKSQDKGHQPGLIGCYISHLLAWQNNIRTPEEYVIFLEDDYIIPPDFKYKVKQLLETIPDDADIGFLMWFPIGDKSGTEYIEVNKDWQKAKGIWSTACIVVKTKSIQKLTDTLRAVEGHIDIILYEKGWAGELNVYYTKESIGTLSGQKSQIRVF